MSTVSATDKREITALEHYKVLKTVSPGTALPTSTTVYLCRLEKMEQEKKPLSWMQQQVLEEKQRFVNYKESNNQAANVEVKPDGTINVSQQKTASKQMTTINGEVAEMALQQYAVQQMGVIQSDFIKYAKELTVDNNIIGFYRTMLADKDEHISGLREYIKQLEKGRLRQDKQFRSSLKRETKSMRKRAKTEKENFELSVLLEQMVELDDKVQKGGFFQFAESEPGKKVIDIAGRLVTAFESHVGKK